MIWNSFTRAALFGAIAPLCGAAMAQVLEGPAAYGDWRADAPGVTRRITAADMPEPYASPPKALHTRVAPRPAGATPRTLPGFKAELALSGLNQPRVLRRAPNGDVFLAESGGGRLRVLRFVAGEAQPRQNEVFAAGLDQPFGIAFYPPGPEPRYVYVGTPARVQRFPYRNGDLNATAAPETVAELPGDSGHWTRDLAFSPDGATLYVSIGSRSNVAEGAKKRSRAEIEALEQKNGLGASGGDETGRADVKAFDPTGGHEVAFANGLRNCSGLAIRPGSRELWCVVNERDMLGDDLPPDYVTHVEKGGFYGWPWYYVGAHEDPRHAAERPDLAAKVTSPDLLIQPHSAPLGLAFYEGGQFPPEFKGDAFVALHGSWNRSKITGFKVVRVRFANGKPTGDYQDFLTGFVLDDTHVWGRPVDVVETADGALLVSDDANGAIWRVS
ncbi:MAG TPA: PQQ-dependent sugar dehydrogenase, partial [Methylocystis sp.]|nr:PQQ-dependent sugar dehydrogenase [Methylocystis sp.]